MGRHSKPTQVANLLKNPLLVIAVAAGVLVLALAGGALLLASPKAASFSLLGKLAPAQAEEETSSPMGGSGGARTPSQDHPTRLIAFYANFDEEGYKSLERNAADVEVLMPMWYHLGSDGQLTFDSSQADRVNQIIRDKNPGMKVMPIVNNYDKAAEKWNAPQVAAMIADPAQRVIIAERIVQALSAAGYDGVNIDFESFTAADRANLVAFMAELYPRAKAAGLEVSMDVIVTSQTYDHAALAQNVDYLVPMMYDEHWKTSPAGPISSLQWFDATLQRFLSQVPANKTMVGLGTYSYDWGSPGSRATSLTYQRATDLARQYGQPIGLTQQLNPSFGYTDAAGVPHSVWMLDAVSAFDQVRVAQKYGVRGFAVWRMGSEDPTLWKVLHARDSLDRSVAESLVHDKRSIVYDDASGMITSGLTNP